MSLRRSSRPILSCFVKKAKNDTPPIEATALTDTNKLQQQEVQLIEDTNTISVSPPPSSSKSLKSIKGRSGIGGRSLLFDCKQLFQTWTRCELSLVVFNIVLIMAIILAVIVILMHFPAKLPGVLPESSTDDAQIKMASPSFEKLEDLSVDKLYDFLLAHDQNLKPLAEKFKTERVSGIDLMNFRDDDYRNFSVTYGQRKQLKLLIKQKQLASTSNSTASTSSELDLSVIQNEQNHSDDIVQNQQIIIKKCEDTVEKLNQQIHEHDSTIKQLQKVVQNQSQQILTLMGLLNQQLSQSEAPLPRNYFTEQPSAIKDQLTNISADIQLIPIVPPGSLTQAIPIIHSEAPTAIRLDKSKLHVPARMTSLPTSSEGPNSSVVTFPTVYHPQQGILVIKPIIKDAYNISNYGTYKVKIYSEDSQHILVETSVTLTPQIEISVPKQFEVRDSINNLIVGGIVTLKRVGEIAVTFTGKTNQNGTVNLPDNLADGTYEVEIYSPNNTKLQRLKFSMVIFQNRRQGIAKPFIGRGDLNPNEIEVVLRWAALPNDLDSHLYSSDGKHVYYKNKTEGNMSLDSDITTGNGPETVKFIVQPNLKYVYAVHRFSNESMLTQSKAELTFNIDTKTTQINKFGKQNKLINGEIHKIPELTRPQARFWIVGMVDGSTKQIKFFENVFEDHNSYDTNEIGLKYFTT